MNNLVIAAIPDENDLVWKISSEKIPHMTLLFLGDVNAVQNLEQIILFVEHAANTTLRRFYLPVDRRDVLGADQADVLFFKKGRYDYKAIRDFRATLLQDNNIKTAYDSSTQFDGVWQPHLTLGYPATPAKSLPDNYGPFYDVAFNKIAVWTEDFNGPDFLLRDYMDDYAALEAVPMDVAMSDIRHAAKVSDTPWSQFSNSDYTDEQYARACLLDRGVDAGTAKQRYGLPVREPSGTLNRNGCHAAAAVLSSKGGTGSARGNKMNATTEQLAAAKKKLVALYNGPLNEDVPEGLGGKMAQTVDLGAPMNVILSELRSRDLTHYGVKGMRWGQRKAPQPAETHREGIQKFLDPQGHKLSTDVAKTVVGTLVPIVAPLSWPAQIRLIRGGVRGAKAKALDTQEKKFAKNAMSPKTFAAIHNGAVEKINHDVDEINKKYPNGVSKDRPQEQKKYNDEVLKAMQDGYRASANSLSNKAGTQHLDVEFVNDGLDFKIHARSGTPTPMPGRVKHAAQDVADEEITVEITGKIKRDAQGYIVGFEFDDLNPMPAMHSAIDLGSEFVLEHFGIKGMRWGQRKADISSGAKFVGRSVGIAAKTVGKAADTTVFELNKNSDWVREGILDSANEKLNADLPGIKAKHGDYGKLINRVKKPFSPEAKAYRQDVKDTYLKHLEASANEATNIQGSRRYTLKENGKPNTSQYFWDVSTEKIQHVDSGTRRVQPIFDNEGWIVDLKTIPDSMAQIADFGVEFLSHFGIKGMHWGVRKAEAVTTQTHIDTGLRKRQTQIEAKGGQSHPAHPDAIKAAVQKQKLKKSGTNALSTQELRDLANRLQVENQVHILTSSKGKQFVSKQLETAGQQELQTGFRKTRKVAPHVIRTARRGAATAATVAALA